MNTNKLTQLLTSNNKTKSLCDDLIEFGNWHINEYISPIYDCLNYVNKNLSELQESFFYRDEEGAILAINALNKTLDILIKTYDNSKIVILEKNLNKKICAYNDYCIQEIHSLLNYFNTELKNKEFVETFKTNNKLTEYSAKKRIIKHLEKSINNNYNSIKQVYITLKEFVNNDKYDFVNIIKMQLEKFKKMLLKNDFTKDKTKTIEKMEEIQFNCEYEQSMRKEICQNLSTTKIKINTIITEYFNPNQKKNVNISNENTY